MRGKLLLIFFVADAIFDSACIYLQKNEWRYITKPLLIIALIIYSIIETKKKRKLFFLLLSALICSLTGDILLMFERISSYFIFGLSSFLIAHIFYILLFLQIKKRNQPDRKLNLPVSLFAIAYIMVSFLLLNPFLGNLLIPVLIYTIVIVSMFHASVHAFNFRAQNFGKLCIIGAAIFVLSDSALAANKFYHSFFGAGILVMLTYSLAQLLIVVGATRYLNSANND